jgi:hypothetical protein
MTWTSLIAQGKRRLWMSLFLAVLAALVFGHLARFYQGRVATWILLVAGIPVALNLLRAGLGLAYRLDRHPFRLLDLGLVDDQVAPGRALEVELVLEARRKGQLKRLAVELRATRTRTTDRGRQSAILHDEKTTLEEGLRFEPGLRKSYRASIPLPATAPYSFRSMEGKIVWTLAVEGEVEGWGSLRDEIEITVAPA